MLRLYICIFIKFDILKDWNKQIVINEKLLLMECYNIMHVFPAKSMLIIKLMSHWITNKIVAYRRRKSNISVMFRLVVNFFKEHPIQFQSKALQTIERRHRYRLLFSTGWCYHLSTMLKDWAVVVWLSLFHEMATYTGYLDQGI